MSLGCVVVPLLLQNLRGTPKVFLLLQQLCAVAYVTLCFFSLRLTVGVLTDKFGFNVYHMDFDKERIGIISLQQRLMGLFALFFAYQHLGYSLLQSLHYHAMIADPLSFEKYGRVKKVIFRVLIMTLLSAALACERTVEMTVPLFNEDRDIREEERNRAEYILKIFRIVKYSVVKVVYTAVLIVVAYKIWQSMEQSRNLRGSNQISPLFVAICVIPIVNDFVYLIAELPEAILPLVIQEGDVKLLEAFCTTWLGHFVRHVQLPLTISIYTFASVLQCAGFLACFPKLREGACLKMLNKIRDVQGRALRDSS